MRRGNSKAAAVLILFLIAAFVIQGKQTAAGSDDLAVTTAQQYLTQAIPAVNRGADRIGDRGVSDREEAQTESGSNGAQELIIYTAKALTEHSLPILAGTGSAAVEHEQSTSGQETIMDNDAGGGQILTGQTGNDGSEQTAGQSGEAAAVDQPDPEPIEQVQTDVQITDSVKAPDVLIYHTHATESYQPVSEGNFHSVEKSGTVRQVGDVMAKRLEELGYSVIHDETIHDNPSYNQSYSRSMETAKGYLNKYKNVGLVIDLHRDAAGYVGNVGKTVSVEGKMACAYAYVIGQGNPNVSALTETVNDLNRVAEGKYPGFTGRIIEKAYKFNQYISDHHILLEVGNNENTIEQAELTGYYMAEVVAAYLKERGL